MRPIKEIEDNPAIIKESIERWHIKNGVFQFKGMVKTKNSRRHIKAFVKFSSNLNGWDHLSVSFEDETPSWDCLQEMKEIFWLDDEFAIQIHPAKKDYINNHPHCLHLWRPINQQWIMPPTIMVGFRGPEYKEDDIKQLMELQEEIGSPITREQAESLYIASQPSMMNALRALNLELEKKGVI